MGRFPPPYNYDAKGNVLPAGLSASSDYRYFETELYFGDTWKITPSFSLDYGLHSLNYTITLWGPRH